MKFFSKILLLAVFFAATIYSASSSTGIENISFQDKTGRPFTMTPFHVHGKEKTVVGLYGLFQQEEVYKYYENGQPKDKATCEHLFDRVSPRFQNWQGDQLGWVAILNEGKFVGFVGANISGAESKTIEVCCALDPSYQKLHVTTNALMEYFLYFWDKLNKGVTSTIESVKSPINPRNQASAALSKSFYPQAVSDAVYVPSYYETISREKGERVSTLVPIKAVLEIASRYQEWKAKTTS